MIDRLDIYNNEGLLTLARKLKDLKYVVQVRWHLAIRPEIINNFKTPNVVFFLCMVESMEKGKYLNTCVYVPESIYNSMDENIFANTVIKVSNSIDAWRKTGDQDHLVDKTFGSDAMRPSFFAKSVESN